MARALAALGADVTGYDPFIEGTEPVAHGAGRFRLVKASADAIPEPAQSADLVLFIFSLHHVPGAKLQARSPRRGGFCGHRAAFTSPSRCRRGRINT